MRDVLRKGWRDGPKILPTEYHERQEDYPDPPEGADAALICALATDYPDGLPTAKPGAMYDNCQDCEAKIVRGPYVPKGARILCYSCATRNIPEDAEVQVHMSRQNVTFDKKE